MGFPRLFDFTNGFTIDRKINLDLKISTRFDGDGALCATIRTPFRLFQREVWTTPLLKPFQRSGPGSETFVSFLATVENYGISCFAFGRHK